MSEQFHHRIKIRSPNVKLALEDISRCREREKMTEEKLNDLNAER